MSDPARTTFLQLCDFDRMTPEEIEIGASELLMAAQEIDAQLCIKDRLIAGVRASAVDYMRWRSKALYAKAHIEHAYRKYKIKLKELENGRRDQERIHRDSGEV